MVGLADLQDLFKRCTPLSEATNMVQKLDTLLSDVATGKVKATPDIMNSARQNYEMILNKKLPVKSSVMDRIQRALGL
jgi:hypothetical protein